MGNGGGRWWTVGNGGGRWWTMGNGGERRGTVVKVCVCEADTREKMKDMRKNEKKISIIYDMEERGCIYKKYP